MNWRVFKKAVVSVLKDALPVAIMFLAVLALIVLGFVGMGLSYRYFDKAGTVVWLCLYIPFVYFGIAVFFRMQKEAEKERELAKKVARRFDV